MDTTKTRNAILHIERIVRWNLAIFIVACAFSVFLCLITVFTLRAVWADASVGIKAYQLAMKHDARIDAQETQLLNYMKLTVQYWDKLSKDNPKVKVPKAVVPVPTNGLSPPAPKTDAELTRTKPSPAPPHRPQKHSFGKPKPRPTPNFWERFFHPK